MTTPAPEEELPFIDRMRALAEKRGVRYFELPEFEAAMLEAFEHRWSHAKAEVIDNNNHALLFEYVTECLQLAKPVPSWAPRTQNETRLHGGFLLFATRDSPARFCTFDLVRRLLTRTRCRARSRHRRCCRPC